MVHLYGVIREGGCLVVIAGIVMKMIDGYC